MEKMKWRQLLHLEPPDGWLNDPNGLCFFNGKYHVYFQHSPNSPDGKATRCWSHYSGKSLVSMKYDGIVLKPDIPEDMDGVYSGSAIVHENKLHIFYTGNVKEKNGSHDFIRSGRGANVIHVISPDGHKMEKKQVVLRNRDYPDFCSCHVRDPKIWRKNGIWNMVLGARTLDNKGCVLIYNSDDLENWKYSAVVSVPDFGYMWECPDYFTIGESGFLSVSPQGLKHHETIFQNVYQSGYFSVNGQLANNSFGNFTEWDMGFDFYAPQTFEAPDGRWILIGWMGIGDSEYTNPTIPLGWQHCLTLPREITLSHDKKLLQNPVGEIDELFGEKIRIENSKAIDAQLPFDLSGETNESFSVSIDGKLELQYNKNKKLFALAFKDSAFGGNRTIRKAVLENCRKIRIIADMSSLEIYLNGGETVMSTRFYPDGKSIKLTVSGGITAEYAGFRENDYEK